MASTWDRITSAANDIWHRIVTPADLDPTSVKPPMDEKLPEQTLAQQVYPPMVIAGQYYLPNTLPESYAFYREVFADEAVQVTYRTTASQIFEAGWTIDADEEAPEGAHELIEGIYKDIHRFILDYALRCIWRYGWVAFEKVFKMDDDGNIVIDYYKRLLNDITYAMVEYPSGKLTGIRQRWATSPFINIPLPYVTFIASDVDGTMWYGVPVCEYARLPYIVGRENTNAASLYSRNAAVRKVLVRVPPGDSNDAAVVKANQEKAQSIVEHWDKSGIMTLPTADLSAMQNFPQLTGNDLNIFKWHIEIPDFGPGMQPVYTEFARYIDSCKIRSLGFSERGLLEAQSGTRADASEHRDVSESVVECMHMMVVDAINKDVDQLLEINFGKEAIGSVRLVPNPIHDTKLSAARDFISKNPSMVAQYVNMEELAERMELPILEEGEENARDPALMAPVDATATTENNSQNQKGIPDITPKENTNDTQ